MEYIHNSHLLLTSCDNYVKLWNINTGSTIKTLKPHTSEINWMEYDPQRNTIITASDQSIKLIDLNSNTTVQTLNMKNKIYSFHLRNGKIHRYP